MLPLQALVWKLAIERQRDSTESILLGVAAASRSWKSSDSGVQGVSTGLVPWPDFYSHGLAPRIPRLAISGGLASDLSSSRHSA